MVSPLSATLKVVRCSPLLHDPALDEAAMLVVPEGSADALVTQYINTRDPECLRFTEARVPTWFTLRRLPVAWMSDVLDPIVNPSSQRLMALRAGCHLIEIPGDPLAVQSPGTKAEGGVFVASPSSHGVTLAPQTWAQEIADRFGALVAQEMGQCVIDIARLPKGAKGPFGYWGGSVASR